MRAAFGDLQVRGRIGVNTGEVVVGTAERLATGDAVNVAARLKQAAEPDQILLGESTLALVAGAVDVQRLEALALKGKAQPVAVYRLDGVHDAPERQHDLPFVGRERESALLDAAWNARRVSDGASCSRCWARRASASRASSRKTMAGATRGGPRTLPAVRRGHHVLAGRRGGGAARRAPADAGAAEAISALLGEEQARPARGDRVGVPQAAGGSRRR